MILKRDVLGRVTVTPARREELLDEFERSGLKGQPFSKLVGVNYQTFASWVQKRRRQRGNYPPCPHGIASGALLPEQCEDLSCDPEAVTSDPTRAQAPILIAEPLADESCNELRSQELPKPLSANLTPAFDARCGSVLSEVRPTSNPIPAPPSRSSKAAPVRRAMDMPFMECLPPPHRSRPHEMLDDNLRPMVVELPGGARLMLRGVEHVGLAIKLITALRTSC